RGRGPGTGSTSSRASERRRPPPGLDSVEGGVPGGRSMRRRALVLAGILGALTLGGLVVADVLPGQGRSARAKDGVAMREKANAFAKVVETLPYGKRVTVTSVSGYWAEVRTDEGSTGWVRAADLVEPGALTGKGAFGASGAGRVSSS